jgi:pimeloyl-ACP methyl ester carboxylesterase
MPLSTADGDADEAATLALMAAATELEIEANGLRFETLVDGPDDGEAVILLHGYPQSAGSWSQIMEWLTARKYRSIAPNLRGYSPGANPPDADDYTTDQLVADVVGIADALGATRFHLVGHDWGGALAWSVAARHPERLLSLTSLSTPHPAALHEALRTSTQALRSGYIGLFRLPRVPEAVFQLGNFSPLGLGLRLSGLPRDSWERDRRQLQRAGGMHGPLNWYRGVMRRSPGGRRQRRITVPTLYVWGRRDRFLGRRAAELTAKYVAGPYVFEELDAGHWLVDHNAADLERLVGAHLAAHPASTPRSRAAKPRSRAGAKTASSPKAAAKPASKRSPKRSSGTS